MHCDGLLPALRCIVLLQFSTHLAVVGGSAALISPRCPSTSPPLQPHPLVSLQTCNRGGGGLEMGAASCVCVVQMHAWCLHMRVWPCVLAPAAPPFPKLLPHPTPLPAHTRHEPATAAAPAGWRPTSPAGGGVAAVCTGQPGGVRGIQAWERRGGDGRT